MDKYKTVENASNAIIELFSPRANWVEKLASGNGKELGLRGFIAKEHNAKFYFAQPYSSWERGLYENSRD